MTTKAKPDFRSGLMALAGMALGFALGWQVREFMAVDHCLDAGGAWLREVGHCIGAERR